MASSLPAVPVRRDGDIQHTKEPLVGVIISLILAMGSIAILASFISQLLSWSLPVLEACSVVTHNLPASNTISFSQGLGIAALCTLSCPQHLHRFVPFRIRNRHLDVWPRGKHLPGSVRVGHPYLLGLLCHDEGDTS